MIRLEDFGDFVSLATIEYKDRLFSKMNYIDMIDDNSIEISKLDNGKFLSVVNDDINNPILTDNIDYNRILLYSKNSNKPPKIYSKDNQNTEEDKNYYDVEYNGIIFRFTTYIKTSVWDNQIYASSILDADDRSDRYIIHCKDLYYNLQITDDSIGAIISGKDIQSRCAGSSNVLVKDIPYLCKKYNSIYIESNSIFKSVESIFIETDEYGIPVDFISDDPAHIGATKKKECIKINSPKIKGKGIRYEKTLDSIYSLHPLFIDPVDYSKIYNGKLFVLEKLVPKESYKRVVIDLKDEYTYILLANALTEINKSEYILNSIASPFID